MHFIKGMTEILNDYDGFIVDLWGVIHNGSALYPGVIPCLEEMKARGKRVVFLSNAPRRAHAALSRLQEMGLPADLYEGLVTSGEAVHGALKDRTQDWSTALGFKCYHIGASKDLSLFEEDVCVRVALLEDADFILNSGIEFAGQTVEDFEEVLQQALALNLPMVCANPDLVVHIGSALEYCAGAIAKRYEDLGGTVHSMGKPYGDVYARASSHFPPGARILAIGDAFETDIKGAQAFGIDSAFVGGGIHRGDLQIQEGALPPPELVEKLCEHYGIWPTYVIPGLIL